jgi:hypothetical protein
VKKTALALALSLFAVLTLSVAKFQAAILTKGNIFPLNSVTITFPENDKNYNSSTLTMRYQAYIDVDRKWIVYSLDGAESVTILDQYGAYGSDGNVTLSSLSAGPHCIEIRAINASWFPNTGWFDSVDKVYFNVLISPSENHISILSPQNGAHYSEPVLLNFTTRYTHFPEEYSYFYAIDGQSVNSALDAGQFPEDVQFIGTETVTEGNFEYMEYTSRGWDYLPKLPAGFHSLTLYSRALYHGVNDYNDVVTVHFTIDNTVTPDPISTPSPELTPMAETFPAKLFFVSSVVIALVAVGLFVYFKKRQKDENP